MACDTKLKAGQTIQQRAAEVRAAVERLGARIVAGTVRVIVGRQGAVAFDGWNEQERDAVTDACALRRILATGSALAKAKIAQAEQIAGRQINKQAIAHGHHSHDGGKSWHTH